MSNGQRLVKYDSSLLSVKNEHRKRCALKLQQRVGGSYCSRLEPQPPETSVGNVGASVRCDLRGFVASQRTGIWSIIAHLCRAPIERPNWFDPVRPSDAVTILPLRYPLSGRPTEPHPGRGYSSGRRRKSAALDTSNLLQQLMRSVGRAHHVISSHARRHLWQPTAFSSMIIIFTSTKDTMDPEGSARNSCNSWPLYARGADQRACFG